MTRGSKSSALNILCGVSEHLGVFSIALAMGVCSNLGIHSGIIAAVIVSLFGAAAKNAAISPTHLIFLVFMLASFEFGRGAASAALFAAGVMVFLAAFDKRERFKSLSNPVVFAGLLLAGAFCMTVMETTLYFGIGSSGGNVVDMMGDYISRGFHPNWRGILYGTITLVIMITYPRKFKAFSKKLSASFVSVAVTLVLNLALNPDAHNTAIEEVGYYSLLPSDIFGGAFFNGFCLPGTWRGMLSLLICAAAMASLMSLSFANLDARAKPKERAALAAAALISAAAGGVPLTFTEKRAKGRAVGVACALLSAALFALRPLISRVPIATLAVILIATAWQAVDWRGIGQAMAGGVFKAAVLMLQFVSSITAGVACTVILTNIFSAVFNKRGGKKI